MPDQASRDYGRFEILPARAFTIITRFQRTPSPARLAKLRRIWDDDDAGIVLAAKITDGEYAGRLHPYEGGTRVRVKQADDPDYLFPTWIRDMTGKQASKAFLSENKESMKPSAFSRYRVGTAAEEADALAIKTALDSLGILASEGRSVYGNGEPGEFSAFAAAERIVKRAFAIYDSWEDASLHLAWCIDMGRRAYPQHGVPSTALGHDADIIQALSAIGLRNNRVVDDELLAGRVVLAVNTYYAGNQKLDRLFIDRQTMEPAHWRTAFVATRGNVGGSESRGTQIQKLVVANFHRGNSQRLRVAA